MFEDELNIKILNKNETTLLGILHPNYVQVSETNEQKGFRTIQITHPLTDDNNKDLSYYADLLSHSNKIYRENTADGNSCLYVLLEDKEIDSDENTVTITAEEVATELSMLPPKRFNMISAVTINSTWLNTYFGDFFTIGTVTAGKTFLYSGTIGIMDLLREIETQTGCEFQFRYEYDPETDVIHRYLDFTLQIGKTIKEPIMIGYNTDNIVYEDTEADVAIAAAPTGSPSDSQDDANANFHKARKAFEDLAVVAGTLIPSWNKKDENGVLQPGPNVAAPFSKSAGQNYVSALENASGALYTSVYKKEKSASKVPRTALFDSSEEDPINLYWACVDKINETLQPAIKLTADNMADIRKITELNPTYFNVGDTVALQLPGRYDKVTARIAKTSKDPREPESDKVELGNYNIDFFADYVNKPYQRKQAFIEVFEGTAPETSFTQTTIDFDEHDFDSKDFK